MLRASDVDELYELMRNDEAFNDLRRGKNPLIPGEGLNSWPYLNPSGVFIVGEAPGADEVTALRPFVGASGRMLRALMASIDLFAGGDMPNCWLTNAVKYRPPRNRTPTLVEIMKSRPYLRKEWALVGKPSVIVAVGAVALTAIRGQQLGISKYAGRPLLGRASGTVWPMFHPAFGLRGSEQLRNTIEGHWLALGEWLNDNNSRHSSR
jgi:uracil-DNA glycosylase family 4